MAGPKTGLPLVYSLGNLTLMHSRQGGDFITLLELTLTDEVLFR